VAKRHSVADARSNLPQLIRDAEAGEPVELTRRGEGVAALIGWKEYERFLASSRSFSAAWNDFQREFSLAEMNIDPDEVFAGVRDHGPGRDSKL
jgi:prevent-host-death family protein